jgi:peptidoglycan/xylan/chitin deacetylase (PgdA/CDA1 family)
MAGIAGVNARWIAAHRGRPPLVLTYHAVGRVSPLRDHNALFCPAPRLLAHVHTLRRLGYRLVTFGQLADRVADGGGTALAAITFDDGFETTARFLTSSGIPATVFVVGGWLGRPHPHAAWTTVMRASDAAGLAAQGVEIGSHTMSHADLENASLHEAAREWEDSRRTLEQVTGQTPEVAAYPFGRASDAAVAACRNAGFRFAAMTDGAGEWDDRFRLPRQPVTASTGRIGLLLRALEAHRAAVTARPVASAAAASRELRRVLEARRTVGGD